MPASRFKNGKIKPTNQLFFHNVYAISVFEHRQLAHSLESLLFFGKQAYRKDRRYKYEDSLRERATKEWRMDMQGPVRSHRNREKRTVEISSKKDFASQTMSQ